VRAQKDVDTAALNPSIEKLSHGRGNKPIVDKVTLHIEVLRLSLRGGRSSFLRQLVEFHHIFRRLCYPDIRGCALVLDLMSLSTGTPALGFIVAASCQGDAEENCQN